MLAVIVGTLFFSYALLVAVVFYSQDSLLYFPPAMTALQAKQFAQAYRLKPYTREWHDAAWTPMTNPPGNGQRGTIIVAHGNAASALGSVGFVEALAPLGFRVVLYEYPGYATNPGKPSETANVEPLRKLVREIASATPGRPVYLFGQSLGCGVVCSALRDKTLAVAGVILLQPWDSLAGVAGTHYPFLPAALITAGRYNSMANLPAFTGPVAFVACAKDVTIPPELSRRLHDAYPGKKMWLEHPNCDHNTWPSDPKLPWWATITDFVAPQS